MRSVAVSPEAPLDGGADSVTVEVMSRYFRAFADPTRVRILQLLVQSERSVSELVAATGQSQPNVSNHLGCLRWCGLVVSRREHRSVYYAIADRRVVEMLALATDLLEDNAAHVACCGVLSAEG